MATIDSGECVRFAITHLSFGYSVQNRRLVVQMIASVSLHVRGYDAAITFFTGCLRFVVAEDTRWGREEVGRGPPRGWWRLVAPGSSDHPGASGENG